MKKSKFYFICNLCLNIYIFIKKYSRKFVNIYLEKLIKNRVFYIYCLNKTFFCKTAYTIIFVVKKHKFHQFTQIDITISSIISEIFNTICFTPPTLRVVFTPSTSTTADKKKYASNIFSKTTIMPNFIKISDSDFDMFPCKFTTLRIFSFPDE